MADDSQSTDKEVVDNQPKSESNQPAGTKKQKEERDISIVVLIVIVIIAIILIAAL